MTVQGSSAYALGTGPWKKGGWTPTAELAGRTTGRSQPNQAQTPLPHRLAPDDPAERMGLSRQRSTTLAASGVTAPIPDVTPVPGDCGISASQSWQREDPASLLSVRSLQLLDVSPFNPAGPPPATCQSEATPSVTFSTRRALYEINNMFQNAPSCEGGGNADPTVTFATRAAMGAIDEMFREEISSSAERSPPTFQVTKVNPCVFRTGRAAQSSHYQYLWHSFQGQCPPGCHTPALHPDPVSLALSLKANITEVVFPFRGSRRGKASSDDLMCSMPGPLI